MNFIKSIEGFLEQVDQEAAKTLKGPSAAQSQPGTSASSSSSTSSSFVSGKSPSRSSSDAPKPTSKVKSDEEIFAFLNNPATEPPKTTPPRGASASRGRGRVPPTRGKVAPSARGASDAPTKKPAPAGPPKATKSEPKERTEINSRKEKENTPALPDATKLQVLPTEEALSPPAAEVKATDVPETIVPAEAKEADLPPSDNTTASTEEGRVLKLEVKGVGEDGVGGSHEENNKGNEIQSEASNSDTGATTATSSVEERSDKGGADVAKGDSPTEVGSETQTDDKANEGNVNEKEERSAVSEQPAGTDEDINTKEEKVEVEQQNEFKQTENNNEEGEANDEAREDKPTREPEETASREGQLSKENVEERAAAEEDEEAGDEEQGEEEEGHEEGEDEHGQYYDAEYEMLVQRNTRLEMENKLLRGEVRVLNDEVSSLSERERASQDTLGSLRDTLHALQVEILEKERTFIKLRSKEEELENMLMKKNSQAAALSVSLEEMTQKLASQEMLVRSLEELIEKNNREKEDTLDSHQQALELLNSKIAELERLVRSEEEKAAGLQHAALERERALQSNIADFTRELAQTQRRLEEKSNKLQEVAASLKDVQANNAALRQELVDYKLRAKKVLQEKEALIEELMGKNKEGGAAGVASASLSFPSSESAAALQEQLKAAQNECSELKQQISSLNDELASLRVSLAEAEEQAVSEAEAMQDHIQQLEESVTRERERVKALQVELLQKGQEASSSRERLENSNKQLQEQLKNNEAQIAKLKRQLAMKGSPSSSATELENSLRAMTDRLIRMQALNESLANEKAALLLRLQSELQQKETETKVTRRTPISLIEEGVSDNYLENNDNGVGLRLRPMASLVPESWTGDPESRRHKVVEQGLRAAHFVDSISAQVGSMLRRSPGIRLLFLLYLVFLHVWVLFLLSRPLEMHDPSHFSAPQPLPPADGGAV